VASAVTKSDTTLSSAKVLASTPAVLPTTSVSPVANLPQLHAKPLAGAGATARARDAAFQTWIPSRSPRDLSLLAAARTVIDQATTKDSAPGAAAVDQAIIKYLQ
jgi:hypothetical protein